MHTRFLAKYCVVEYLLANYLLLKVSSCTCTVSFTAQWDQDVSESLRQEDRPCAEEQEWQVRREIPAGPGSLTIEAWLGNLCSLTFLGIGADIESWPANMTALSKLEKLIVSRYSLEDNVTVGVMDYRCNLAHTHWRPWQSIEAPRDSYCSPSHVAYSWVPEVTDAVIYTLIISLKAVLSLTFWIVSWQGFETSSFRQELM